MFNIRSRGDEQVPGKIVLCQRARNPNTITNLIHLNVSKLRSVDILVVAKVNIHANVSTIENYENKVVTPNSISNNFVQSTVANNISVQQTAIDLAFMMPNSRITLFP